MMQAGREFSATDPVPQPPHAARDLITAIAASRFNYYAAFLCDFACGVLFFWLGLRNHPPAPPLLLMAFIGGILFFTLIEYAIHRWLLHSSGILTHLHAIHHAEPASISAFLFPTSLVVLGLLWLLFVPLLHWWAASFFVSGVGFTYSYYGCLHHFQHRIRLKHLPFRWMQQQWAAHNVHHHLQDSNFGVICPLWDFVFGTHHTQLKRVRQRTASIPR